MGMQAVGQCLGQIVSENSSLQQGFSVASGSELQKGLQCITNNPTHELVMTAKGRSDNEKVLMRTNVYTVNDPKLKEQMLAGGKYIYMNEQVYKNRESPQGLPSYSNLPRNVENNLFIENRDYSQWLGQDGTKGILVEKPLPSTSSGSSSRYESSRPPLSLVQKSRVKKPEIRTGRSEEQLKMLAQDLNKKFNDSHPWYEGAPIFRFDSSGETPALKLEVGMLEKAVINHNKGICEDKVAWDKADKEIKSAMKMLIGKGFSFTPGDRTTWN